MKIYDKFIQINDYKIFSFFPPHLINAKITLNYLQIMHKNEKKEQQNHYNCNYVRYFLTYDLTII